MSAPTGTLDEALARARMFEDNGELEAAASLLASVGVGNRARVLPALVPLLDKLAVDEDGLRYRYVPGGTFRQGNDLGEPDERPAHDVTLRGFWMTETPLSWREAWSLLGWPTGRRGPSDDEVRAKGLDPEDLFLFDGDRIRRQYSGDSGPGMIRPNVPSPALAANAPPAAAPEPASAKSEKPVVAIDWELARVIAASAKPPAGYTVRLPTESEWERAARGLFAGAEYPWGDAPPDGTRADYGNFSRFAIQPMRAHAPNDFGLFAMSGGVWEWCEDDYDACFYEQSPAREPLCRLPAKALEGLPRTWRTKKPMVSHVVRGGSWADESAVLRVSFRSALATGGNPNVGVRLVRARR